MVFSLLRLSVLVASIVRVATLYVNVMEAECTEVIESVTVDETELESNSVREAVRFVNVVVTEVLCDDEDDTDVVCAAFETETVEDEEAVAVRLEVPESVSDTEVLDEMVADADMEISLEADRVCERVSVRNVLDEAVEETLLCSPEDDSE